MKSKDVRRTHVHAYTQTCARTHTKMREMEKGGKEKEKKEARKEKESHTQQDKGHKITQHTKRKTRRRTSDRK